MTPASLVTQESLMRIGTRETEGSVTVWPALVSQGKASPVEPVSGWDLPPVAITNCFERIRLLFLRIISEMLTLESVVAVVSSTMSLTGEFERTVALL